MFGALDPGTLSMIISTRVHKCVLASLGLWVIGQDRLVSHSRGGGGGSRNTPSCVLLMEGPG